MMADASTSTAGDEYLLAQSTSTKQAAGQSMLTGQVINFTQHFTEEPFILVDANSQSDAETKFNNQSQAGTKAATALPSQSYTSIQPPPDKANSASQFTKLSNELDDALQKTQSLDSLPETGTKITVTASLNNLDNSDIAQSTHS